MDFTGLSLLCLFLVLTSALTVMVNNEANKANKRVNSICLESPGNNHSSAPYSKVFEQFSISISV